MGNLGKLHDPLVNRLALEFGNTVLGDNDIDVGPCGGKPGSLTEVGNDARADSVLCPGG